MGSVSSLQKGQTTPAPQTDLGKSLSFSAANLKQLDRLSNKCLLAISGSPVHRSLPPMLQGFHLPSPKQTPVCSCWEFAPVGLYFGVRESTSSSRSVVNVAHEFFGFPIWLLCVSFLWIYEKTPKLRCTCYHLPRFLSCQFLPFPLGS